MTSDCRRHVFVSGRVQGVFFRDWTCEQAAALKVRGWVRNLRDGRVEALLCGSREAVDAMTARMKEGPPRAEVVGIAVTETDADCPEAFERRATTAHD